MAFATLASTTECRNAAPRSVGPRWTPQAASTRVVQLTPTPGMRARAQISRAALPRHDIDGEENPSAHSSRHPDDMPGQTMQDVLTAATHLVPHCAPGTVQPSALPPAMAGLAVKPVASAGQVCRHPGAPLDDDSQLDLAVRLYCASLPLLQHVDDWDCAGLLGLPVQEPAPTQRYWFAATGDAVWNSDDE